jgi:hypothetical protein
MMSRYNVELKYQTTVDAESEVEAVLKAKSEVIDYPAKVFLSHCRKVKVIK